jgi:SLAP domain-containing protein
MLKNKNINTNKKEKFKMTKIIAILLTLALALGFTACGKTERNSEKEETTTRKTRIDTTVDAFEEPTTEKTPEATTETTTEKAEEPTETITIMPEITTEAIDDNYFFNDENNIIEANNISIRPRCVYWDNGYLVAECFVINGYSYPITEINVEELYIYNNSGLIAAASFGIINNVVLQPNEHVVWTFKFAPNTIYMQNADLSELNLKYSCGYVY